jgi:hypothetical protein
MRFAGWVTTQGVQLPMGAFDEVDEPDDASAYGPVAGEPPLPGEDFMRGLPPDVDAPINLADGASTVSLHLQPDFPEGAAPLTGPLPFVVLRAGIPGRAARGEPFALTTVPSEQRPTIIVQI